MKKVSWTGNSLSGAYFRTLYNNKHNSIKSPTKKAEFRALIDLHKPDIVLGCESKLDSTIPTYSVFPSTYDIFRKDWTLHGGGVFIGVRNDIIATEQVHLDVHNCEIITVSIKFAKSKTLLLSSYYRPPAFDTNALDLLDDVLSRTYSPNPPPPGHLYWWLQLWGHRLVDSKPYASYCSSLRPSSLRSFRQIRCLRRRAPLPPVH